MFKANKNDITCEMTMYVINNVNGLRTNHIIQEISDKVKHFNHDHSLTVAGLCRDIMIEHFIRNMKPVDNIDVELCYLMGILHDIGKLYCDTDEEHAAMSATIAENILKDAKVSVSNIKIIKTAIANHSNKALDEIIGMDIYSRVLIEADIISKLTLQEIIGRCDNNLSINENVNELIKRRQKKVLSNIQCITTDAGKKLYKKYFKENENMLNQLLNMGID